MEIQLAILFIPILALRERMPQAANFLTCALIVIGYVINVATVSKLRLPPTFLLTLPDPRCVPWLISQRTENFLKDVLSEIK